MPNFGRALGIAVPKALSDIRDIQGMALAREQNVRESETHQSNLAQAKIQQQNAEIDLAKKRREEAFSNELVPVEAAFSEFAPKATPSVRNLILQQAKDGKFLQEVNGQPFISRENIKRFMQAKAQDFEFGESVLKGQMNDIKSQELQIATALQNPKLKPEEKQALIGQQKSIWKVQSEIAMGSMRLEAGKAVKEGKITPASYQKFMESGNIADLEMVSEAEVKSVHVGDRERQGRFDKKSGEFLGYVTDNKGNMIEGPRYKPATGGGQSLDFSDKELVRTTVRDLPKLKKEAITQSNNLQSIDHALELVKTGVTGKGGQVKAFLAPYAEMLGVDTKNLNDSQTYQLLTRAIVGPMRLDIVGPGPVSEWEQKLMQQISGGGGAAKSAAMELLNTYRKLAIAKVDNYNTTVEGIRGLAPNVEKIYGPINVAATKSAPAGNQIQEGATATNRKTGQKIVYRNGKWQVAK